MGIFRRWSWPALVMGSLPFLHVVGNAWADFFAKIAARDGAASDVQAYLYKRALKEAQQYAKYLGWAGCRVLELGFCRKDDRPEPRKSVPLQDLPL